MGGLLSQRQESRKWKLGEADVSRETRVGRGRSGCVKTTPCTVGRVLGRLVFHVKQEGLGGTGIRATPKRAPSLRVKRSNPDCHRGGGLDCFVASAPRNDGERACRPGRHSLGRTADQDLGRRRLMEVFHVKQSSRSLIGCKASALVGWAKACPRGAVASTCIHHPVTVGTLRFAHPTRPMLESSRRQTTKRRRRRFT
jgi:hypothetical protein